MDMEEIKKYIVEHRKFEMPDFQEQFVLSYSEANKTLEGLEKSGIVRFCEGFTYETVSDSVEKKSEAVYTPKDEQEAFFLKALWECVKSGYASTSLIQRRLSCGYARAARAIDWMEENDYISSSPNHKVKMSVEEYCIKFGNTDIAQEQSEDEERERFIEEHRRALMERLSRMSDDDEDDESDDEDDEEDDEERARREYLERRRAELIERMRQSCNDDDGDGDAESEDDEEADEREDNSIDLRAVLIECLERGLQDVSDDDKFILGFDGEPKFQLKFVNGGSSLRISDGGKTLEQVSQTKRKINNVLKSFEPVKLEDDEISITLENPYGTLMALLTLYSAIDAVKKMK